MFKKILFVTCGINTLYASEITLNTISNIAGNAGDDIINEISSSSNMLVKETENIAMENVNTNEPIHQKTATQDIKTQPQAVEQEVKINGINEQDKVKISETNGDLTENLNINEILAQKYGPCKEEKLQIRTDAEKLRNCMNNIFKPKPTKQERLAKEREVVQRFYSLSPEEQDRKRISAYEHFSKSCREFINKSFIAGRVNLEGKKVFYKMPSATLCVFFGFDLAQIFVNEITFNINLQDYKELYNFTDVLIDMNNVHRKLIEITEKRKEIMQKKGFLKK